MLELWLIKKNYKVNIMPIVASLSWVSHEETLGVQLNFSIKQDDTIHLPEVDLQIGDTLALLDVVDKKIEQIWRGILETEDKNGRNPKSYICFDYAYYLNKSEEIIQFKNISAHKAIEQLLNKYNVKHQIADMKPLVKHIYCDKKVSDIIKDILEQVKLKSGETYSLYMKGERLNILPQHELIYDATKLPLYDASTTKTMSELSNSIIIYSGSDQEARVIAEVKDDESINKYGLIQTVESIDEKDTSKARTVANNLLKQKNRILETGNVTMEGNTSIRAGQSIRVDDKVAEMSDVYFIRSCTQTFVNNHLTMTLDLEVKK